ncbi:hypothetical protein KCU83_g50, partial [Aureobasidium melanogenum]
LYLSALTSPVWPEVLPPPPEAVAVAVVAVVLWALVVLASAVAEAMAVVHLHLLLVVAVIVEATVAAVAEATLLTDELASSHSERAVGERHEKRKCDWPARTRRGGTNTAHKDSALVQPYTYDSQTPLTTLGITACVSYGSAEEQATLQQGLVNPLNPYRTFQS